MTCTIDNTQGYAGSHYPIINDSNIGNSDVSDNCKTNCVKITRDLIIQSISPNKGSTEGNTIVTISGNGFSNILSDNIVTLTTNNNVYNITCNSSTFNKLICVTPKVSSNEINIEQSFNIKVNNITKVIKYTFSSSLTPNIVDVTPKILTPLVWNKIKIT